MRPYTTRPSTTTYIIYIYNVLSTERSKRMVEVEVEVEVEKEQEDNEGIK
jgi:hypothetical protein